MKRSTKTVERNAPLVCFQSGVRIFCDDPSVEKAVHSAVDKFNQGLAVGQKMALYQIVSAAKVLQLHTGNYEMWGSLNDWLLEFENEWEREEWMKQHDFHFLGGEISKPEENMMVDGS